MEAPAQVINRNRLRAQARVMRALAHPARLLVVEELSRGERCVCELTALVGSEMPTVSRHLGMLREAGIIESEKRGTQVFYRLRVRCVLDFFRCVEAVLQPSGCARRSPAPAGRRGSKERHTG